MVAIRTSAVGGVLLALLVLLAPWSMTAEAKVLQKCEIVEALLRFNIPRSFLSSWLCLIQAESGGDTKKVTNAGATSKYGLFQLESGVSCEKNFDGGICRVRCDSLLTDVVDRSNVDCAKLFYRDNGFKGWKQWELHCKQKDLPNIRDCLR